MPEAFDRAAWVCTRRHWILSALVAGVGRTALAQPNSEPTTDAAAAVVARARKCGLRNFRSSGTEHYVGVGDAPDDRREDALRICEKLAKVYGQVFHDKGFPFAFPERPMVVVMLKDRNSYAAYLDEKPDGDEGGHYNVDANELVIFDFTADKKDRAANAARVNTFTLVHEALHQLTFNTGLLDRRADVPVAVSEGLAMYGEVWQHTNRQATLGIVNRYRLQALTDRAAGAVDWIPIETLVTDDALFNGNDAQLAYAESWVLVHYFFKTPSKLPKFRAYLKALSTRRAPGQRLDDAREHLGDLKLLDRELRKYAAKAMRG